MMPVEEDFRTLLLTGGGSPAPVAALVGDRVTPLVRDQAGALPAIVYTAISRSPDYHLTAPSGLDRQRIQIDCYDLTAAGAKAVARAVESVASGYMGAVGNTAFQGVFVGTARDFYEPGGEVAERLYRVSTDYLIWHAPA